MAARIETMSTAVEAPRAHGIMTEEWLREKYWGEAMTQGEIAELAGVSQSEVSRAMGDLGVPTRAPEPPGDRPDYRTEEWLRARYHGDGLTQEEMAELAGVCVSTITRWMKRHGVEARIPDEEIRRDVERVARDLGRRPSSNEYERYGEFSASPVRSRWGMGSWVRAMDALGI